MNKNFNLKIINLKSKFIKKYIKKYKILLLIHINIVIHHNSWFYYTFSLFSSNKTFISKTRISFLNFIKLKVFRIRLNPSKPLGSNYLNKNLICWVLMIELGIKNDRIP